ncbi:sugar-binding protein [Microbacterium sp. ZW T5_45]|uniref:sugar-binding protein n=1 Tax=Microbacterium sp. ZW T5_45 TaxID=3378080 RepID=UPI00385339DE
MRNTDRSPRPRRRRLSRVSALLTAAALAAGALLASGAASATAVMTPVAAAAADAPTLQDYWNGDADWSFVKQTTATESGIMNAADGQFFRTMPDGTWYRFSREWGTGSCGVSLSTVVRASTDQGATWTDPELVIAPEAGTDWSCYATDGGAYYNDTEDRWYYLFQCFDGTKWGGCLITKDGADPRGGGWVPLQTTAVVSGGDLWDQICDEPTDDCVTLSGGRDVFDEGTFDVFNYDGEYYWVAFHGYDGINGYRGIAKTTDFVTWIAGDASQGVPADASFDRKDSDLWREDWKLGSSIGFGHGSIVEQDGYYYQITEAADTNLGCTVGQRWDTGIYRTDDLTSTAWEPLPQGNPILYSSLEPRSDGKIQPCQIQYPSMFEDPTTGVVYLTYGRLDDLDSNRNSVIWLKLDWKTNQLSNGDFWKASLDDFTMSSGATWAAERLMSITYDASPSLSVRPGSSPAVLSQTVAVDPSLGSSLVASARVIGDTTGSITVSLAQLDSAGAVITVDQAEVAAGSGWNDVAVPATVADGAVSLRFEVAFSGEGQVFRADDLGVAAAASAVYTAHAANAPIVVDGAIDEAAWGSAGAVEVSNESVDVAAFGTVWGSQSSRADLTSTFRMVWDQDSLYISEERTDDVVNFSESGEALYLSDAIMVFLDTANDKTGASYRDGDYAILATASDPDGESHVYLREGHDAGADTIVLDGAQIAADIRDDGYTLELSIPWAALAVTQLTPATGSEYGFSLLATDNDGAADWGQIMWSGVGDPQEGWGTLRLADALVIEEPGKGEPEQPGDGDADGGGADADGGAGGGDAGGGSDDGGTDPIEAGRSATTPGGALAQTGADAGWTLLAAAGALALMGAGVLALRARRRA